MSNHVTNENKVPNEVTDNVGDERGDAFRGILVSMAYIAQYKLWK